jgi:hypothetical protein
VELGADLQFGPLASHTGVTLRVSEATKMSNLFNPQPKGRKRMALKQKKLSGICKSILLTTVPLYLLERCSSTNKKKLLHFYNTQSMHLRKYLIEQSKNKFQHII